MTTEIKNQIRQQIAEVCGSDIGDIYPEYFVTPVEGDILVTVHQVAKAIKIMTVSTLDRTQEKARNILHTFGCN